MKFNKRSKKIAKRSGNIKSSDKLVIFLYLLMRDHLTPGEVEGILMQISNKKSIFSNGWLALYAKDIAKRLE